MGNPYERIKDQEPGEQRFWLWRRKKTVKLGRKVGSRRKWGFKVARLRFRLYTPLTLLKKLRDSYVNMLLALERKSGNNCSGLVMNGYPIYPDHPMGTGVQSVWPAFPGMMWLLNYCIHSSTTFLPFTSWDSLLFDGVLVLAIKVEDNHCSLSQKELVLLLTVSSVLWRETVFQLWVLENIIQSRALILLGEVRVSVTNMTPFPLPRRAMLRRTHARAPGNVILKACLLLPTCTM